MKKLDVAVVGAGILGEIHAETFASCERTKLVCIYDIDHNRAKQLSEKCNTKPAASLQDIVSDQRIQAVSIATPDFAHTEAALHLIEAGKHLFIEKPLTTSIAEAERITSAARTKNIFIMVDFQNRWSPTFSRIKKAVDNGEIGKPVMGYIRLSNPITVPLEMLS